MQSLTAVVLGATGLVGGQLVQQLLDDPAFSKVRILVRRPVQLSHPKLTAHVVNFDDLDDFRKNLGIGDCVFCCIGTTISKVKGDTKAYRKVDFDIAVNAAKIAKEEGFGQYFLVSAVGANAASKNFYLRLKGEVENEIEGLHFKSFHIFRPSVLFGKRSETRILETVGRAALQLLSPLMIAGLSKFKGIEGAVVAKAMIAASKSGREGVFLHHYNEMIKTTDL